jgi:hypothetical protein
MLRQKQEPRPELDPFREAVIVCVESFRPSYISREIRKGEHVERSNSLLRQYPAFFAAQVPYSALLEREKTNG